MSNPFLDTLAEWSKSTEPKGSAGNLVKLELPFDFPVDIYFPVNLTGAQIKALSELPPPKSLVINAVNAAAHNLKIFPIVASDKDGGLLLKTKEDVDNFLNIPGVQRIAEAMDDNEVPQNWFNFEKDKQPQGRQKRLSKSEKARVAKREKKPQSP